MALVASQEGHGSCQQQVVAAVRSEESPAHEACPPDPKRETDNIDKSQ